METFVFIESMYAGSGTRRTKPVVVQVTETGCYEVISHKPGGPGYPRIRFGKELECLHRYIYRTRIGPIPKGNLVCHKCDNRMCINPNHLFVGSYTDNNRDMFNKGRGYKFTREDYSKGIRKKKLTDKQILLIRKMKGTQKELADLFGVSSSLISMIRSGKRRTNA